MFAENDCLLGRRPRRQRQIATAAVGMAFAPIEDHPAVDTTATLGAGQFHGDKQLRLNGPVAAAPAPP